MEEQLLKSIWIGKKFISLGITKIQGKEVHFKRFGGLPGMNRFSPILNLNIDKVPFQDRKLVYPGSGDTGEFVRIFNTDIFNDPYLAMANHQDMVVIEHLQRENQTLKNQIESLFRIMKDVSNDDRLSKRLKIEKDRYNALQGNYSYGYPYGNYSSYSQNSAGGGSFGGNDESS